MDEERPLVEAVERITPLDFLEEVYSCNELPLPTRMRAAIAAAPYRHPKLAVEVKLTRGDLGERLDKAWARSNAVKDLRAGRITEAEYKEINARLIPLAKVIEGEVIKENGAVNSPVS